MKLSEYINEIRQRGRMSFSSEEARRALQVSSKALGMSLIRLRRKGELVTLYKNFHLIVPPEYQMLGCLPANQLIPLLMEYLKIPYYVCLLSAAELHGAAHQRPQIFQVMTSKRMKPIHCGKVNIYFVFKKELSSTPIQQFNVHSGYLMMSTPEATAMDLLLYPHQVGGINRIATILTELIEVISAQKLLMLAKSSQETAWIQRLGYILDQIEILEKSEINECIHLLSDYINEVNPSYVPLIGRKIKSFARDKTWRIIINSQIESDI